MSNIILTVSENIAKWVQATDYNNISQEVANVAKRCSLDFIGVTLAGSRQRIGHQAGIITSQGKVDKKWFYTIKCETIVELQNEPIFSSYFCRGIFGR